MRSSISFARRRIASLRIALWSPTPARIAECAPHLAEAAEQLASIERQLRQHAVPDAGLESEIASLKKELRAAALQIEQAAEFHRGWARLLGSAMNGYTAKGEAGPVAAAGTISLHA